MAATTPPAGAKSFGRRQHGWWLCTGIALSMLVAACGSATDSTTSSGEGGAVEPTTSSTTAQDESESQQPETTTSTTAAETTTTSLEIEGGTFESPIPGGEFAQVGDWKVRVVEVTPDATDIVMAENQFNEPPVEGNQFFIVTLEAEYVGTESGNFWVDMEWKAVGPSAVAYEAYEASCGVYPDSIDEAGETFPSGVVTGDVCWSVSTDDAADLVMLLDNTFSFDDSERTVYSLTGVGSE